MVPRGINISPQPGFVANPIYVLGQEAQPAVVTEDAGDIIAKKLVTQLEIENKQLQIEELKSRRLWSAVAGIATLTTALIGVLAFLHARKQ